MTEPRQPRIITGRIVLIGMLAFFGVIIAVNAAFVYFALESWPGLSTENAYREGLQYNRTLADAERQAKIGWTSTVAIEAKGSRLVAELVAPGDTPVSGVSLTAVLSRPLGDATETRLTLAETTAGTYIAPLAGLAAGRWRAEIVARDDTGVRYRMVHTLMVVP